MDRGAKALAYLLLGSLLLGLVVTLVHPDYRGAARALLRGEPASSPLWQANRNYYEDLQLPATREEPDAE